MGHSTSSIPISNFLLELPDVPKAGEVAHFSLCFILFLGGSAYGLGCEQVSGSEVAITVPANLDRPRIPQKSWVDDVDVDVDGPRVPLEGLVMMLMLM